MSNRVARIGNYELLGKLGKGGMGTIFLARRKGIGGFDRCFALKLLDQNLAIDYPQAKPMFLDEARLLSRINHPNVVQIFEVGEENGQLFLVMEYLPGRSLAELLNEYRKKTKMPIPWQLAVTLIKQAAHGLHAIHGLSSPCGEPLFVVHRDVSPNNLMLLPEGIIKVIDFGIAWSKNRQAESTQQAFKGKFGYASPEQVRCESPTSASDIFSLGIIIHELITGKPLFLRKTPEASVFATAHEEAPFLSSLYPHIPFTLSNLVKRSLSKNPASRPSSAAAFADELEKIVQEHSNDYVTPASGSRYFQQIGISLKRASPSPLDCEFATDRVIPSFSSGLYNNLKHIIVPQDSKPIEIDLKTGFRLILANQLVSYVMGSAPQTLLLPGITMPVGLWVLAESNCLRIEINPRKASVNGKRLGMYHDIHNPATRIDRLVIPSRLERIYFEIGHRRAESLRIYCASTYQESTSQTMSLVQTEIGIVLTTCNDQSQQLATFYIVNQAKKQIHAVAIRARHR